MNNDSILLKTRDKLKQKMDGDGSRHYLSIWVGWITSGIYLVMALLFLWIFPNAFLKFLNMNNDINPKSFTFWNWYSINLSLSVLFLIIFSCIAILAYFYKQFTYITLKTNSIEQLKKRYESDTFIVSTIGRWVRLKGFINYADKNLINTYASIDKKINLLYKKN